MRDFNIKTLLIGFSFWAIGTASLFSQHVIADLKNFEPDKIYVKGFTVKRTSAIAINAVGVKAQSHKWNRWNPMIAYGWILNTDTHEAVWAMSPENTGRALGTNNLKFEGTLTLEPGNYEAYYSTYGQRIIRISRSGSYLGEFVKNLVKVFVEDEDIYENADQWHLKIVTKDGDSFETFDGSKSKNVFVDLTGARDSDFLEKGFSVDKNIKVKIYCNGEGQDSRMFDFGWITNDKSAKQVWEMRYDNTSYGGGAEKNRIYAGIITLPAGDYIATYVTDDSHSFNEWNMQPPYDPANWGLSLSIVDENDLTFIRDYKKAKKQEILAITKVSDNQFRSEGFSLSKSTDIVIYSLGEGRDSRMYDYGWITDANTGETVWQMRYSETKFAGGDEKNRLFEGSITLPPGNYMANYRTDGSHSCEDWNTDPPYNKNKWGITLSLANNNDTKNISKYSESDDRTLLAQIVRVGDDEYRTRPFALEKDSKIRILCIGEGRHGQMYDYGWIKNTETGQTVWEMTFGMTRPAGGAQKNRMLDGTVFLEAGKYEVTFISDGSHSFEDWNDDAPNQPDKWGITLKLAK